MMLNVSSTSTTSPVERFSKQNASRSRKCVFIVSRPAFNFVVTESYIDNLLARNQ